MLRRAGVWHCRASMWHHIVPYGGTIEAPNQGVAPGSMGLHRGESLDTGVAFVSHGTTRSLLHVPSANSAGLHVRDSSHGRGRSQPPSVAELRRIRTRSSLCLFGTLPDFPFHRRGGPGPSGPQISVSALLRLPSSRPHGLAGRRGRGPAAAPAAEAEPGSEGETDRRGRRATPQTFQSTPHLARRCRHPRLPRRTA